MSPDVNFPDGPVLGLAHAVFDTIGGTNADMGSIIDWELHKPFDKLLGKFDETTTDSVSLFGTLVFQHAQSDVFNPADPIGVITFFWQPDAPGAYTVNYATETDELFVWEGSKARDFDAFPWRVEEAAIAFEVVPGVATPSVIALGFAVFTRRRRPEVCRSVTTALRDGRACDRSVPRMPTVPLSLIATACVLFGLPIARAQDGHVELVENEQFEGPTQSEAGESLPPECSIAVRPDPARPHPLKEPHSPRPDRNRIFHLT
jgi:hypothetical protein